jgi:hypothetical protein
MKRLTVFAAITFFLLGCSSAFGQTYLGFLSKDMSFQYCDSEALEFSGVFASGYDDKSGCGALNSVLIGLKATLPPSNLPLTGTVYVLGDSALDADCDCFSGDQGLLIQQTKPYNIHAPHFGWETLFNTYDAFYAYLDDWGYLTNNLPVGPITKGKSESLFHSLSRDHNMNP